MAWELSLPLLARESTASDEPDAFFPASPDAPSGRLEEGSYEGGGLALRACDRGSDEEWDAESPAASGSAAAEAEKEVEEEEEEEEAVAASRSLSSRGWGFMSTRQSTSSARQGTKRSFSSMGGEKWAWGSEKA